MAFHNHPAGAHHHLLNDDCCYNSDDDFEPYVVTSNLNDKPKYLLEHLATFTVNKDTGIVVPADGMRRLLQLEKTTGIWSQKMQLCLDRKWVLIVDYETGKIIERFPASLIQEPTSFTSDGPMDIYNNVLVFIVSGGIGQRSEMHIFQCQSISAIKLVENLKQLKKGKIITQLREIMPLQSTAKSTTTDSYINYQRRLNDVDTNTSFGRRSSLILNDDVSSTTSEKYERDVSVLNHCFDDIEKFIARLQHAAAAARELERRRLHRKTKKRDIGDGLLTMRTKPPYEKEFFDIFAKFKLSFNLLAKLKAHIHDPNAPELIHFLFTPLALIVDASHDTHYEPNLSARVIDPLLTREAINLLGNCVTSKETELWRSLGDAWNISRDEWKGGYLGSYHPVFFDGWSPDYPVIDYLDDYVGTPKVKRRIDVQRFHTDFEYDPKYNPPASPGFRDFSVRSDISGDSIERRSNSGSALMVEHYHHHPKPTGMWNSEHQHATISAWLDDIYARGGKIIQVAYPRTANNDKELSVGRGEFLEILDDSRKWWKARNWRGQIGHIPHTIVGHPPPNEIIVYNTSTIQHTTRHIK